MSGRVIGVIGGSGLYRIDGLADVEWRRVESPFGPTSDEFCFGNLDAQPVVFLPRHKRGGTYLVMEGPQFSTLAESELYRAWKCDLIGMTNMPEAKLAREAEICYATVAMVTDYDCWHPGHEAVTVDMILSVLNANAERAKTLIR